MSTRNPFPPGAAPRRADRPTNASGLAAWMPLVGSLVVWFAHFMVCWTAAEVWPHRWPANLLAWVATVLALLVLAGYWRHLRRGRRVDALSRWVHGLGLGATALAAVAVVFSALPSLVFLP